MNLLAVSTWDILYQVPNLLKFEKKSFIMFYNNWMSFITKVKKLVPLNLYFILVLLTMTFILIMIRF